MKHEEFHRGVRLTLLSAASMSLIGLVGKLGITDLSISSLLFWRFFSAFVLYALVLACLGKLKGALCFQETRAQVLRGVLILASQYCYFYYLEKNSLLNASALLNTGPIFIALFEWGIFRQKVGVSSWVGSIVAFIGAIFILQPDAGIISYMSLIGLLSGLTQGASQIVFGKAVNTEKLHIGLLHLFALCSFISLFPMLFFPSVASSAKEFLWIDLLWIALLGIGSIFNQMTRAKAYRLASPSKLAPFLYASVLLAGIWDWVIFHDTPDFFSILGTFLIILGGILKIYLRKWILHRKQ